MLNNFIHQISELHIIGKFYDENEVSIVIIKLFYMIFITVKKY